MDQLNRAVAEAEIEALIKAVAGRKHGRIVLQEKHVKGVAKSGARRAAIGPNRTDKVWGWAARALQEGKAVQKITTEWSNTWMSEGGPFLILLAASRPPSCCSCCLQDRLPLSFPLVPPTVPGHTALSL